MRKAFVSVPWGGPTDAVRAIARAFVGHGLQVSALGGDPGWARAPGLAQVWARRACHESRFTGVHLDIEPWTLPEWPAKAESLLTGVAQAADGVARAADRPVAVDLAPTLARTHREAFTGIVRAASSVTLMSYRDTASAVLDFSAEARHVLRGVGRGYRLAVDTLPSSAAHTTFFGQPASDLDRETRAVAGHLRTDEIFSGVAVHDLVGWMSLG